MIAPNGLRTDRREGLNVLKRVEGVSMQWSKRNYYQTDDEGYLKVSVQGREYPARLSKTKYDLLCERQARSPVMVAVTPDRYLWWFQDRYYWDTDKLKPDEVQALLVARQLRAQREIAQAKAIVATGAVPQQSARTAIPDDVRRLVFQRDGGRCANCGSNVDLQFDHVIPVSLGGASTPENVQVLCGPCNRAKGADLTVQ